MVCCVVEEKRLTSMAQKKLLKNGKAFKRTDNRWGGTVWYMDERGERKRKSFSGTTKAGVTKKMTDDVATINDVLQGFSMKKIIAIMTRLW